MLNPTLRSLQEEGIPAYWATEPELLNHARALEEDVLREQARLEDEIARNSAALPDMFGKPTKEYTWSPKKVSRAVLKRPKTTPEDQLALVIGDPRRRYTKEAARNYQDFHGHELSCLLGLLEATADDLVQAQPGSVVFYDAWLWIRLPEPSWKAFSFACCCEARGSDPDQVRNDLERLIRLRLGEEEWTHSFRRVLTLTIAEASRFAATPCTWKAIAGMRDELATLDA